MYVQCSSKFDRFLFKTAYLYNYFIFQNHVNKKFINNWFLESKLLDFGKKNDSISDNTVDIKNDSVEKYFNENPFKYYENQNIKIYYSDLNFVRNLGKIINNSDYANFKSMEFYHKNAPFIKVESNNNGQSYHINQLYDYKNIITSDINKNHNLLTQSAFEACVFFNYNNSQTNKIKENFTEFKKYYDLTIFAMLACLVTYLFFKFNMYLSKRQKE